MSSRADRRTADTSPSPPRAEALERLALAPSHLDAQAGEDRYVSVAPLGRGGMGEVGACRDRHLGRVVAVKRLLGDLVGDATGTARFVREARIQAQLEHAAIVPVYELAEAGGVPYLTMKRVEGETLERVIERLAGGNEDASGAYPRRRLLSALGTVCLAVDYAHARGVVHRDLKPSNLMLGDYGEVFVLDWGVALVNARDEARAVSLLGEPRGIRFDGGAATSEGGATTAGAAGTPRYMAPEQLGGDAEVDARADVYALGAILFEILTLEPLHRAASLEERHASPDADVRVVAGRDIPAELLAICERATARNPDERFASARSMFEAIDRFLAGEQNRELYRASAKQHASAAVVAAERATSVGASALDERERAMREVGRALALDPDNADALRVLIGLLADPPPRAPDEVNALLETRARRAVTDLTPAAAAAYLCFLVLAPVVWWMGVRSYALATISALLVLLTGALTFFGGRRPGAPRLGPALVASTVTITITATMFGPYTFVPALTALNTVFFVTQLDRRGAVVAGALGCVPILLPALLSAAGALPPTYAFDGDRMCTAAWMHGLRAGSTELFLIAASVGMVVVGAILAGRFRELLASAERRLAVHAWQLERLVPRRGVKRGLGRD